MRDHVWGSADTKVGVARIVAVIVLACGAVCCCQQAVFASPPNILLIVSEDHGPELGCYGDPYAKTPRLDALAAEGVRFDRAFVAQAGCSPSRASFLTGLYPHEHGQVGLATWGFRLYRPDTPNVVRSLSDAGYRTGLIGKLHVNPPEAFPFDFHKIKSGNFAREDLASYAEHAAEFFAEGDQPFFLSVNYPDAHGPWLRQVDGLPPEPLDAADVKPLPSFGVDTPHLRSSMASYYNCLMRLDTLVGDLLDALDRSGKADNTLVVAIGDHGADMLRGKRTCYEGGLRIPMIVRWPGQAKAGQVRDELVSTVDLVPTFLEAAGAPPLPELRGLPLQPLLAGDTPPWRSHLFAEYHTHAARENFYPQRSVRDARFKLIENLLPGEENPGVDFTFREFSAAPAAIVAAGGVVQAAYATMRTPPRYELYDLEADPYEFTNLAGSEAQAEVRDALAARLAQWRRETSDPLLDAEVLQQFKTEVQSITKKKQGRDYDWQYPSYFFPEKSASRRRPPNVLMIAVDDMNDWVGCLGGHPDVDTPHIDALAARGLLFANAHCPAPVCNPSRVAILTGRAPSSTGIYDNATVWHEQLDVASLPSWFREHGYCTVGGGKIAHHMPGFNRRDDWDDYFEQVFDSPYQQAVARGEKGPFVWPEGFPRNGLAAVSRLERPPVNPREFDWGPVDAADAAMGDGQLVEWAAEFLRDPPAAPFFLAVGIYRPHLPWYAPRRYFDRYPVAEITSPPRKDDDLADLPAAGLAMAANRREDLELIQREGRMTEVLQAYLANISYADALIGRLLEAMDSGPAADDMIIVLWSDHGWHLGEKDHLHKFTLWERSTRVPLVIVAPGTTQPGTVSSRPVGLIDLFPTLAELCGLPEPPGLDGRSLVPLLADPHAAWDQPALTTHGPGNHALRSERYRYIRYADGGEELYDHSVDPNEWTNLAVDPAYAEVKDKLAAHVPQDDAVPLRPLKKKPRRAVEAPRAVGEAAQSGAGS